MEELEEKKKQEAERRAAELEQRRKKLEEMRRIVAEDNTPQQPPEADVSAEKQEQENTRDLDHDVVEEDVSAESDDPLKVRLDFDTETEWRDESTDRIGNHGNVDNQSCDRDNVENERRQSNEIVEGASAPPTETFDTSVPSLVTDICEPEPDIIQSTKRPIELPVTVPDINTGGCVDASPPPKAPPRRKKKSKPVVEIAEGGAREPTEKVHSPTSATILHLTKDFENSLDLNSATFGAIMVETKVCSSVLNVRLHKQSFQCTQYAHFNDCTNRR
jgi:hypothetical protein